MAVPYNIGRKLVLSLEDSKVVVSMLTDQSKKLYQKDKDGNYHKIDKVGDRDD